MFAGNICSTRRIIDKCVNIELIYMYIEHMHVVCQLYYQTQ